MKLALLKGNRFNPWHMSAFSMLDGAPEVTAFRAESEIQRYFAERDDSAPAFAIEPIYFDTDRGNPLARMKRRLEERFAGREARIVPFHDRLKSFDLIQTWELFTDWSAEAIEAKKRFDIPAAVMVWDNIPFNMERNPMRRAIKESVAKCADRFLVHTERSLRMLEIEGVANDRIEQIDPGVDTTLFSPGPPDRKAFNLDEEDFVILFVGWLLPRKGIDFLLLALRELMRDPLLKDRRIRLLAVGSGPGKDRVEALIRRIDVADACTFAGALPYGRMPEVFRAANAFVLPSIATPEWQEQFGMSLIEAMATSVPIITTFSGAIPEIVGDAAVLCQPNDFVALHDALRELILDPTSGEQLGHLGRERAVSRFGLNKYAAALSKVYAGLC